MRLQIIFKRGVEISMKYRRFWIFYYRVVAKELKWKHDKIQIKFGNWISVLNFRLCFDRFEFGVNFYHFTNPMGVFDRD